MGIEQGVDESGGICRFRFRGECNLTEATELVRKALAYCRVRALPKLFVDARGLTGLPIPSLIDRFLMVEEWAQEAGGVIVMVLVVQPQYIEPRKFGVKVAQDLGFKANVFPDEAEALVWLSRIEAE